MNKIGLYNIFFGIVTVILIVTFFPCLIGYKITYVQAVVFDMELTSIIVQLLGVVSTIILTGIIIYQTVLNSKSQKKHDIEMRNKEFKLALFEKRIDLSHRISLIKKIADSIYLRYLDGKQLRNKVQDAVATYNIYMKNFTDPFNDINMHVAKFIYPKEVLAHIEEIDKCQNMIHVNIRFLKHVVSGELEDADENMLYEELVENCKQLVKASNLFFNSTEELLNISILDYNKS